MEGRAQIAHVSESIETLDRKQPHAKKPPKPKPKTVYVSQEIAEEAGDKAKRRAICYPWRYPQTEFPRETAKVIWIILCCNWCALRDSNARPPD